MLSEIMMIFSLTNNSEIDTTVTEYKNSMQDLT